MAADHLVELSLALLDLLKLEKQPGVHGFVGVSGSQKVITACIDKTGRALGGHEGCFDFGIGITHSRANATSDG
ncbi:MAG: hypothetical protein MI757_17110 [Pirellulales bacterium]|nr:hypothetical protein [Pirellulales bacterium]